MWISTLRGHRAPGVALLALLAALGTGLSAWAAEDSEYEAHTVDPNTPTEELALMLRPLTQDELAIEAAAWLDLLKSQVEQIAAAEIHTRKAKRAAAEVQAAAAEGKSVTETEAAKDVVQEANVPVPVDTPDTQEKVEQQAKEVVEKIAEKKQETLDKLPKLREVRAAIVARTNLVLDAWETKGGDPTKERQYVAAVSDLTQEVDVYDPAAVWTAIRGWLLSWEGGLLWALNIIKFILAIIVFGIISRIAGGAVGKAMSVAKTKSDLLKSFMSTMTRRVVFFIGLVFALSLLGMPITPFLAAIGGAALVIGLALQGTLSNFASGIMILLHRPFDVGDVVNVAGVVGTVKSMSVLSTEIGTFDNQTTVVPNNSIWGGVITNITGKPTRRVDMMFGIGYGDDIAKALRVLTEIIESHELVLKDPEPTIKLHELGDSSVNFIVRPWSKTGDYWAVYWDVTRQVKERFDAEGISIPFPQRDVHLYQETPEK